MRIMLIRTLDEQHIYSIFTRSLCEAFRAYGVDADVFDYPDNSSNFVSTLIHNRYDVVISFSSFMGDATIDNGISIYDALGVNFLGWQFDHPIYIDHFISNPAVRRHSIYPNVNHIRFVEAAGLIGGNTVLLPGADPSDIVVKDFADRNMDVFAAATWNGLPIRHWEALEDSPAKRIIARVVDFLIEDPEASLIDSYKNTLDDLGYNGLALNKDIFPLLRAALTYVRHLDRIKALKNLASSGISLTVCGDGWEEFLSEHKNVRFIPNIPFPKAIALYGDAKVAVNLNAGNGGCERAINAMIRGSCVVSEFSSTLSASFSKEEIKFFDRRSLSGISESVAEILESDGAEDIAARGMKKAAGSMLWVHKVVTIMDIFR
ncbi:hypothetical protein [Caulobacter sp. S45]|uniref:glycosyltransferase family protein n=1 Tax=Caulobacter sp. S45 TaxID=1641861 RepID=UPI00131D82DA|nr:hypothetical protein [Caulobacter sp. S45]